LEWGTDSATDNTKMPLAGGTFTGDVIFTGDSSNGLWDKSASAFVANLTGNVTGNVSGSSSSCTGNAATATVLATARAINGVNFNGSAPITITAAAGTLTGATLASGVTASSLTSVGTLTGLNVTGTVTSSSTGVVASFKREGTANGQYDFKLLNDAGNDCSLILRDSKASATRLTISSAGNTTFAGNVGIGVDPTAKLHIDTSGASGDGILLKATDSTYPSIIGDANRTAANTFLAAFQGLWNGNRVAEIVTKSGSDTTNKDDGYIAFRTTESGGSITDRVTIATDGKVGIGTVNPTELLDVSSTGASTAIEISAGEASTTTGEAKLVLRSLHSSSGTGYSRSEIASLGVAGGDSDLIFRTTTDNNGPQERMRIDDSGRLLIGTTTAGSAGADELTINTASGHGGITIRNDSSSNGNIWFSDGTSGAAEYAGYVQYDHSADALKLASGAALALTLDSSQNATFAGTVTATSFSGSGANLTNVNATTLDSIDSGSFLRSDADDTATGVLTLTSSSGYPLNISGSNNAKIVLQGSNDPYIRWREGTTDKAYIQWNSGGFLEIDNQETGKSLKLASTLTWDSYTVWHSGNDGGGSGLDADTLDTLQASSFVRNDLNNSVAARVAFHSNNTNNWDDIATSASSQGSIEVYNQGSGNDAFMAFHSGSDFAFYFGLDADANDLAVGGWSMGANKYRVIHQNNVGSGGALSSKNVYVNQIHGDGSNLTNLPASGGTITATASGALTAGDPVIVNSDGTVSKIAQAITEITLNTDGDENKFIDSNTVRGMRIIHVPDSDYFVVVYHQYISNSNRYIRARAVTVSSGGALTFGAEYTVGGTNNHTQFNVCYDPDLKKVLCVWIDQSNSSLFRAKYIHSSDGGSTLTFGSENTSIGGSGTKQMMSVAYNTGINKFLIAYKESSSIKGQVLTGSGSSISAGSEVTLGSDNPKNSFLVAADATSSFIVQYQLDGTDYLKAIGVSVSGTTPSASSHGNISNTALQNDRSGLLAYNPDKNMFISMYTRTAGVKMKVLTISGNTISKSSEIGFDSSSSAVTYGSLAYDSLTKHIYLYYGKGNSGSYPYAAKLQILSSTSISVAFNNPINTNAIKGWDTMDVTEYEGEHFWAPGLTHHIFLYRRQSDDKGYAKATKVQNSSTNVTSENYIGTSKASYSNAATATINISGSLDENQSSLTAGQKYFVQGDGSLGLTEDTVKVFAGTAVSATKLLVNDQQPISTVSVPIEILGSIELGSNYGANHFSFTGLTTGTYLRYQLIFSQLQFVGNGSKKLGLQIYNGSGNLLSTNGTYSWYTRYGTSGTRDNGSNAEWRFIKHEDRNFWDGEIMWHDRPNASSGVGKIMMRGNFMGGGLVSWDEFLECSALTNTDFISGVKIFNTQDSTNLAYGRATLYGYRYS